jgi:hypothetical protein
MEYDGYFAVGRWGKWGVCRRVVESVDDVFDAGHETRSMEEARGIMTLVGNHSRVLQMRSGLISQTQTQWQR